MDAEKRAQARLRINSPEYMDQAISAVADSLVDILLGTQHAPLPVVEEPEARTYLKRQWREYKDSRISRGMPYDTLPVWICNKVAAGKL
jgi:hypothetical protein